MIYTAGISLPSHIDATPFSGNQPERVAEDSDTLSGIGSDTDDDKDIPAGTRECYTDGIVMQIENRTATTMVLRMNKTIITKSIMTTTTATATIRRPQALLRASTAVGIT